MFHFIETHLIGCRSNSSVRSVKSALDLHEWKMQKYNKGYGTFEEAYEALDNWKRWKI